MATPWHAKPGAALLLYPSMYVKLDHPRFFRRVVPVVFAALCWTVANHYGGMNSPILSLIACSAVLLRVPSITGHGSRPLTVSPTPKFAIGQGTLSIIKDPFSQSFPPRGNLACLRKVKSG